MLGLPSVITTDQGREFRNEVNAALMTTFGIKHRLTTAYHPQANGLDERYNQTLINSLSKFAQSVRSKWDEKLPEVVYAYNTAIQNHLDTPLFKQCLAGRPSYLLTSM